MSLISEAQEATMPKSKTKILPVLPIKNTVLFPYIHMPFSVGRPASVAALDAALATEDKEILVDFQLDTADQQPSTDDLFPVGVRPIIQKLLRVGDVVQIIVFGAATSRI